MSEDFRSGMEAAIAADLQDTEQSTLPSQTDELDEATRDATADTAEPATGEEEWHLDATQFDQVNPDLARYRKQLQADYSRKTQELSERQKAYEGVDPDDAAFLRQVSELATWNPQAAAEMLDRAKQQLLGPYAPPQPRQAPAPEEEPEFATEVERQLWMDRETTRQELSELRAWRQQETHARNMAQINEKFARLETEVGRQIPTEERNAVANWCMKNAKRATSGELLLPEVDHAWKLINWDKARAAARSEASSVVERKAGIGNGPSTLARGDAPPREPKTLHEALRASMGLPLTE